MNVYTKKGRLRGNVAISFTKHHFSSLNDILALLKQAHLHYRTAYCGPNGVLSIEVSLYRTNYCGPSGVLSIEVSLYIGKQ